jgi:hypothetical protein
MAAAPRVPLFDRLPELHRVEDERLAPAGQLRALLALVEEAFGAVHESVESLYHDLFIETCDDWVIPYIADLLGTSHLQGDPVALRRDVAGTIGWRRRKGTLGVVRDVTKELTGWGVHAAELFEDLAWSQELDHQRPDSGGLPPYALPTVDHHTVVRGGTATIRDPSTLALLGTPFDSFARMPDFRAPGIGEARPNLPNLAIFLWRLATHSVGPLRPRFDATMATGLAAPAAARAVRFELNPLGEPVQLFNPSGLDPEEAPLDAGPDLGSGPIHPARLDSMRPPHHRGPQAPATSAIGDLWLDADRDVWHEWDGAEWNELEELIVTELAGGASGRPELYVAVAAYDPADGPPSRTSELALELHLPEEPFSPFDPAEWRIRGASLLAWEQALRPPLAEREIAIDPRLGRIVVGVRTAAQAKAVRDDLRAVHTYGAVGDVGSHPVDRQPREPATRVVGGDGGMTLADALGDLQSAGADVVVEIDDDELHELDFGAVAGSVSELGGPTLRLATSLTIRAADRRRPIVRLSAPLRVRARSAARADATELRLAGIWLTRGEGWTAGAPLIARADLGSLVIEGCTLDPGGALPACAEEGRRPIEPAIRLDEASSRLMAAGTHIVLRRSVAGPLLIDRGHRLTVEESIVDGGSGAGEEPSTAGYAITGAGDPGASWGPELDVSAATFLGRVRVERAAGRGGIWTQPLEVLHNQTGCIKHSYLSGLGDRLPQTHACVRGTGADAARLRFVSEVFGQPAYCQLADECDFRIRERGPGDDEMGAFGFLLTAHRRRNVEIRYREFLPLGIRPQLVAVT